MDAAPEKTTARRRYHFHYPGVLYVFVTLLVAIGAINSQNNLLFATLGLAIGGLLISGVLSGSALLGLHIERVSTPRGVAGQPLRLRYQLRNTNRLIGAFGLHIVENPGPPAKANWTSFFPAARAFVPHLRGRQATVGESEVIPERRGIATLESVQVWSKFPFGLARKSITIASPMSVVIHPPDLPLVPGLITRIKARAPYGVGGERNAGLGDEFFGLREYIHGDNPRMIAWKRSARGNAILVRQQATPAPTRLWVVLRFPRQTAERQRTRDEQAIALAASILRESAASGVAVGLAVPAAGILHSPRSGRWHLDRLLGDLATLDAEAARANGHGDRLPETAARSGACVVIHAGSLDEGYGPRWAVHLDAARAPEFFQAGPETQRILALFEKAGERGDRASKRSRIRRRQRQEIAA